MALKGTAVITGAGTGIGQALAVEAAARGLRVAALAHSDGAEETVELIRKSGGMVEPFQCDITDPAALSAVAERVAKRMGNLNYLLANAGRGAVGTIEAGAIDDFERVIDVNIFGTLHTVRNFLPYLRRTSETGGDAAVMIMGSEHSLGVPPNQQTAAYTISKHGLLGFADILRRELSETSIGVTFVAPGWTLTPVIKAYVDSDPQAAASVGAISQTPELVAAISWDAIQAKTFMVPTNSFSKDIAMNRINELLGGFEAL